MDKNTFVFREFERIEKNKQVGKSVFNKLRTFIVENKMGEIFRVNDNVIIPQSYIGVFTCENIEVEILSKVPLVKNDILKEKKRFLEILENVDYFKEKILINQKIDTAETTIFEVFIRNFIDEVEDVVKKGLSFTYSDKEENSNYFRGKLNVIEQIKKNIVHRERFAINYDEFSFSSPENCLIKLTLKKLKKVSRDKKNIEKLDALLYSFKEIKSFEKPEKYFNSLNLHRLNSYYIEAMKWAKIFLTNKSTSVFSTDDAKISSLLFSMDIIFENYIGNKIKKVIDKNYFKLRALLQDSTCSIFSSYSLNEKDINESIFKLKPDIVIENPSKKEVVVLDTKWKVLDKREKDNKFNISTENIYQMLTYIRTYNEKYKKNYFSRKAYLIYPATENMGKNENSLFLASDVIKYKEENTEINVFFVDMSSEKNTEKSLRKILEDILV